jgi:ribose transport system ATP-binding protein
MEHVPQQKKPFLEMRGIVKNFGGVQALKNAQLTLRCGEIHALMGENGAGKSTLIKVLSGAYQRDSGEILVEGKAVDIANPREGKSHGISVIYQEFALAGDLSVAENIFLEKISARPFVHWKSLNEDAKERLQTLGFGDIDVKKPVSQLSVAWQQVVEICKALSSDIKVLVLDEPTAVLTSHEAERLFALLRNLKERGVCIVYVSHRLEEIFSLSDCITIMKDGEYVDTVNTKEITPTELVTRMIGRKLSDMFPVRKFFHGKEVVLEVNGLHAGKQARNISFKLHAGEILGFSGLIGSGRTESMRALFGADKKDAGQILIDGGKVRIKNPNSAVKRGVGMLPEDRKAQGVLLNLPVLQNITMSSLKKHTALFGIIQRKKERASVTVYADAINIKMESVDAPVATLSGGNQQKVALARWLAAGCRILILDEPTRGVDVGAKAEIYKVINDLAAQGIGIIFISSEMPELIGMCDRAIVMRNGAMAGTLEKKDLTENNLIRLAMGVH